MSAARQHFPSPAESQPALLQSSSRSSHYGAWGRSGAWGSRRSSWNSLARGHSLKHKPPSAEHESLLSGDRHRVGDREPDGAERVFHHRRTLSLDNKGSCDLLELASIPSGHRGTCRPGTTSGGSEHQDCNGRMPSIAKEIFPKMNNRKERGEDDEEIDYVSTWCGEPGVTVQCCGKPQFRPQVLVSLPYGWESLQKCCKYRWRMSLNVGGSRQAHTTLSGCPQGSCADRW